MKLRSDLALELREMFAGEICGVESHKHDSDGITVTHVNITTQEAAEKIGKPIGNYVTVEIDEMAYPDDGFCERAANAVCSELKKILPISAKGSVLVVGLGNRYITPDSIGPKTVSKLTVTRHISKAMANEFSLDLRPVSAIAPGVLGVTGIETGEIVKGVVEHVKPDLIIAVDALAARKLDRLGTTLQLCNTGISPGSGVGNNRKEITQRTLGVPVIAIGVPMVADVSTLIVDVIENLPQRQSEEAGNEDFREKQYLSVISKLVSEEKENMIVTPNDVDIISEHASEIIATAINMALFD